MIRQTARPSYAVCRRALQIATWETSHHRSYLGAHSASEGAALRYVTLAREHDFRATALGKRRATAAQKVACSDASRMQSPGFVGISAANDANPRIWRQ